MTLTNVGVVCASEANSNEIKIIATQDVHCAYEKYDKVATLAKDADILIDAGDAIEGDLVGTVSKGKYIIDIMNYLDYDIAGLGNHEFDYGIDTLKEYDSQSKFDYVCCNVIDLKTGKLVFDPYKIVEVNGKKIAFVGVVTPATLYQVNPLLFKDDLGNYIYSLCEGNAGEDLYSQVQKYVDEANEKADYVMLIAHLGIAEQSKPWTCEEVIANISGVDAVLDGHSHSIYAKTYVDKSGKEVPAIQTGTKLENVAEILIEEDGTITVENIPLEDTLGDKDVKAFLDTITAKVADLKNKVVAKSLVDLSITTNGERAVRNSETNIGNLCADAYRYVLGADVGFVNGGGIRESIKAGTVTNGDIISVHPFNNKACLVEVTGQQIKDALEMGVSMMPAENGGFLQVSGLTYTADITIPSSVVKDEAGAFVKVAGEYRVRDIMIGGKPIDLNQTYTLASHDYMLKSQGDGFAMFGTDNVRILRDEVMNDNEMLISYIVDNLAGVIGNQYKQPQGRMKFIIDAKDCKKNSSCVLSSFYDLDLAKWYHEGIHDVVSKGLMNGIDTNVFNPNGTSTRAQVATVLYRMAGSPDTEITTVFTDFYPNAYYAKATSWCYNNGIVYGVEPHTFGGDLLITREQFAAMLYRFAKYMGVSQADLDAADVNTLSYEDIFSVSEWAQPAMHYCIAAGIIQGNAGFIRPLASMTRAEMATMLYRYAK